MRVPRGSLARLPSAARPRSPRDGPAHRMSRAGSGCGHAQEVLAGLLDVAEGAVTAAVAQPSVGVGVPVRIVSPAAKRARPALIAAAQGEVCLSSCSARWR